MAVAPRFMPVVGKSTYTDTFGADRGGGSRSHKGVDIFGDRGQPIVAMTGGTVQKAVPRDENIGGIRTTVRGDDGRYYYYAHLDSLAPIKKGDRVEPGQPLGTLGNSGNAKSTPPHLHFSIGASGVEDGGFNAYDYLKDAQRIDPEQVGSFTPGGEEAAASYTPGGAVGSWTAPNVDLGGDWSPNYEVPDYPTTPVPLSPELLAAFAERQRGSTRDLQQAMAERNRGRQELRTSFKQFLGELDRQSNEKRQELGNKASSRNLNFQPAFVGRGRRDIRDQHARDLGRGQAKVTERMAALERAVSDAERKAGVERGSITRDKARGRSSLDGLLGGTA